MKVVALSPVMHDGTTYQEDETFEVSEEQGQTLVRLGVAKTTTETQGQSGQAKPAAKKPAA